MIDESFLRRCSAIAVCTWSDALDQLSLDGVMRGIERRAGQGRFAGRAVTVKEVAGSRGAFGSADFAMGRICDAVRPGNVLVVDMGGAAVSTVGGNAATALKGNGAAAVIIDGACRDIGEIETSGLWVASRHVTPVTGKGRVQVQSIGEPVVVGGVSVRAGDIIIGDEDGIVVVPAAKHDEALAKAEECHRTDLQVHKGIRAGLSFGEAAKAAKYL